MNVTYQGQTVDFASVPFYQYCKVREGYRNHVYADVKGLLTVGIGHLLPQDGTYSVGDYFTDDQVQQLFVSDYNSLQVETYISENANYTLNQMLAIGHFIWGHGAGAYQTSNLRQGMVNGTFTADSVQSYLAANWDIHSPSNQKVNAEDFAVAFSPTEWAPGFFLQSPSS